MGRPAMTERSPRFASLLLGLMIAALAMLSGVVGLRAQTPASPDAKAVAIEDIVIGSRVLAEFGVLDGFGHVSARDPANPDRFWMARSLAPALVTADDIMEFDLD